MVPIKYRAWDYRSEKMYTVLQLDLEHSTALLLLNDPHGDNIMLRRFPDKVELMQFIGLAGMRDGKSVSVYEGDVVRVVENDSLREKSVHIVEKSARGWLPFCDATQFIDQDYFYSVDAPDIEVLGNIFENADLGKAE